MSVRIFFSTLAICTQTQFVNSAFKKIGWNILSVVSAYPAAVLWMIADADAIHQVTHDHAKFPKPAENYKGLARFGNVSHLHIDQS